MSRIVCGTSWMFHNRENRYDIWSMHQLPPWRQHSRAALFFLPLPAPEKHAIMCIILTLHINQWYSAPCSYFSSTLRHKLVCMHGMWGCLQSNRHCNRWLRCGRSRQNTFHAQSTCSPWCLSCSKDCHWHIIFLSTCCLGNILHILSIICLHTHYNYIGISSTLYTFSTSVQCQGVSCVIEIVTGDWDVCV